MLEKVMYYSWKSRMSYYMMNRHIDKCILESSKMATYWLQIEENEVSRPRIYSELSPTEAFQAVCVVKGKQISFSRITTEEQVEINSGKQRTIICYNCKEEGHMSKQCTKPKRKRDDSWFKDKVLLVQAQVSCQILHVECIRFLADPGIPVGSDALSEAVEQHRVESKTFEVKMNQALNENERLLGWTKLFAENEHLKQTYKQRYDSIKPARVRSKEQCADLTNQVNLKSMEISDLNACLQEKVLVAHSAYIKRTQEEAAVFRDLVDHIQENYPLDPTLESAYHVVAPKGTAHVQHSKLNANFELKCVKCNGCMLSDNHDLCVLDYINNKPRKSKTNIPVSKSKVVQIVLWYLDSGCSKHMIGDRSQLTNFVNKFSGIVKFRNNHVAKILGYGDYQIGESRYDIKGFTMWKDLDTTYSLLGSFVIQTLRLLFVNMPASLVI
ncbi:integrase, catalytic region, zinc finger, CCHC-type containing protein [Tanacetum coccineum]